jgi:hypothetical protein
MSNVTEQIRTEQNVPNLGPKGHTAYLNPETQDIYVSTNRMQPEFWTENKIAHAPTLNKALDEIRTKGELVSEEFDKVALYQPRFQAAAEDYYKAISRTAAVGGIMAPDNFSTIDVTNVLSQLRGLEEKTYVLQDSVSQINTSVIEGRIDVEAGFDIHKNITMGAEIPTNQVTYTTLNFKLPMLGAHVARFQEMTMTNLPHDPYRNSINIVGKRVIKAKAELVKDAITAASVSQSGSSWIAFSGGDSSANPFVNIGTAADTIIANDGNPDTIVMNDRTYRAYVTNTWISGTGAGSNAATVSQNLGAQKVVNLPGTGLTAYIDSLISNSEAYIFQKDAIVAFQGPSAVTTYDDVHHRSEGYYYWEYYYAKIIQDNRIVKMTGISP